MARHRLLASTIIAAAMLIPAAAMAGKADDTLVYASDSEPENVSPYHNNLREGVILSRHAWDTLIYSDPADGKYKPYLATSWTWTDPKTLDLDLRQGVKFHNGDSLTADDVVFTFNYVQTPAAKVVTKQNVDWIKSAEKLGDYKVRIHLKEPFPAALEYLSGPTPIYPAKYFQAVGLEGFAKAPIGSGPYRITAVNTGKGVRLERFDGYFADSPIPKPKIAKLEFRVMPDSESRVAALMTGAIDWTWRVPHDQAMAMKSAPGLSVLSAESMRIGYIGFDSRGTSSAEAPFKDLRVRQAVAMAIDRKSLVDNLVGGGSNVMHAACFPSQTGCDPNAVTKYEYNPRKAKELLAEAGYPQGFKTEIQAYRERDYAEAIMGYLKAVGIDARLNFLKYAAMRENQRAGTVPLVFNTWGSFSVNDASASTGVYFKGGDDDTAKDPEVIKTLTEADATVDPDARKAMYRTALKRISDQLYWLPLFSYSTDYVFTDKLAFQAYPDELPRFYLSSWK